MSQEKSSETTRRAFLGTATVATAASLTDAGRSRCSRWQRSRRHHQSGASEYGCSRATDVTS